MPAISKIRLCNILYENGKKRYNDQLFHLDGQNTAILLENGGGKTVFIQTLLQCIIPHISMADRKIKDTLYLENGPAHIAIEWILQDQPRRYGLTCVTLYLENASLNSLKYAYEYSGEEREDIEALPFKVELSKNTYRPATKGEIGDYYQKMTKVSTYAKVFSTIQDYGSYLENNFKIVPSEWRKVATINSGEGNVDEFFNRCKTTAQLLDYLLLPVVAEAMEGDYHQRFAETFEKQREHFQKNRVLNEKIEQASMVKEEINSYIDIYKKYVKTQEESGFLLGKARAQYEFVEEKIRLLQQEKDSLIGEKEAIAEMRKEQLAREISYKLFEIDERMEEYDQKISLLEEQLTKLLLQRDQAASRRQNIQITKINQLVKEMEGEIQRLKVEIAIEEKNMPAEDLLKQLEENSSHIKGHFFYELEKLETEIVKNKQRMNEKSEKSTQVKGRLEGFTLKKDGLTEQIHRLQAVRNFLQEKMDQIYDGLFEEEIGRQMDQEAKGWLKQKAEIEAQIKQSEMEEYRFGQEIEELHQEVSDFQKEKTRVESEAASISQEFTMVEQEAQQCYQAFFKQGFEFQSHELIYTKEEMMKELIFEHEQRLMDKKRKLRYPISVLCEEEVFEKVLYKVDELQTKTQSLIVVRQNQGALLGYETHKDQELMEQLTDFHEKSQETERELALCEDKLYALQQLKEKHQSFFRQYPYEKYQSLMNQSRYLELEVSKLKNSLEEKQRNIFEKEGLLKELLLQRVELQEYSKNLDEKISKANEFEAFSIQYEEQRNREETLFIQWKDLEIQIRNARSELDRYVEELRAIEHYNKEYDYEMKKIKESSLYLEVVNFEAFCTNEDFSVLKSQRESIKSRLLGISSTRNQLVQRLQEQEKLNEHYQDQKTRLYKEAEYEIEEVSVFYSHEEDELFDQMMEGKKEIRSIENQVKQSEKERYALGTNREMLLKELHEKGLERIPFEGGIENAKQVIKIFEGTIQNREKTRLEKENRLVHDISFLGKLHNDLLVKEGSFQFLGAKMVLLSIKERKQLEINLQEEIYELFKKLTIQRNLILQEGEKVQKEKQKIMDYCDHSIKDYRLKEGLIQGLLQKETVAELESYKEKLSEIIDKTIQLANDDKRESDIELNNFLKHLFVYVQTMLHELDELQKKTSIEVQGELKQIFLFEIPSYEEHVAKEALRKYLEKIVDHYDEGIDEKEQRASMEEKLHINNLIPVVLENREIKVRCRKVSNDLLVNMTPLSWEFSNKWSGGEKWSKNMTLFLGILNYLAEKKQYLSVNQKRNRTVILDNPFGKASSKHVLDPVFFIAEKLGFQMIALTAHAEGQFISDYFPVVYSLRLRGASKDTKLVTAGRTINHVYLKENSPQSIERFKEVLQLDLFT